ncbi:MAG: winged helix-turn-helix domain-containing protein [Candidatus Bathyarchaeia archaeon]|jgi:predicted transcriptional regulator
MSTNHWKKLAANETRQKIKRLIALKPRRFTDLLNELKCSPTTLTGHLNALRNAGVIRSVVDSERNVVYEIAPDCIESVKAEMNLSDATQFIESLDNPLYVFENKGNYTVSLFAQWANVDRAKTEKQLKKVVGLLTRYYKISHKLKKGDKEALVVTITGE